MASKSSKIIHHELMHALGYQHMNPIIGQNSVMVRQPNVTGDLYYSTGDIIRIQERYCNKTIKRINEDYKRVLQEQLLNFINLKIMFCSGFELVMYLFVKRLSKIKCQSSYFNGTRLNFYDRFCDGSADCEGGEDEISQDQELIKIVEGNKLYQVKSVLENWAITFEVKPTGVNRLSDSSLFEFKSEAGKISPSIIVKKGTNIYVICLDADDNSVCEEVEVDMNVWTRITLGVIPMSSYPYDRVHSNKERLLSLQGQ